VHIFYGPQCSLYWSVQQSRHNLVLQVVVVGCSRTNGNFQHRAHAADAQVFQGFDVILIQNHGFTLVQQAGDANTMFNCNFGSYTDERFRLAKDAMGQTTQATDVHFTLDRLLMYRTGGEL